MSNLKKQPAQKNCVYGCHRTRESLAYVHTIVLYMYLSFNVYVVHLGVTCLCDINKLSAVYVFTTHLWQHMLNLDTCIYESTGSCEYVEKLDRTGRNDCHGW